MSNESLKRPHQPIVIDLTNFSDEEDDTYAPESGNKHPSLSEEAQLHLKRKRALINKRNLLNQQQQQQQQLQQQDNSSEAKNLINLNREQQIKRQNDQLKQILKNYPPLKQLPTKYQIDIKDLLSPNYDTMFYNGSAIEMIKSYTTIQEEIQERNSKIDPNLSAFNFRSKYRSILSNVVHRLGNFKLVYKIMENVLNSGKTILNLVNVKLNSNKHVKKLLLRYSQISNYISHLINSLNIKIGEIGILIDSLSRFQKEILSIVQKLENLRLQFLNNIQIILPNDFSINKYLQNSNELVLINETINTLFKFSIDNNPFKYHLLRRLTSNTNSPPFQRAQIPTFSNPYMQVNNSNNEPIIIDEDEDENENDYYFNNRNTFNMSFNNDEADDLQRLMDTLKETEVDEEGLEQTPPELIINLMKHQRIGLSWLLKMEKSHNKGGILADDMGLGKTVQAIALMLANKSHDLNNKTNLIVAPVSLLQQWKTEMELKIRDSNRLKIFIFHGQNKLKSFEDLSKYDVIMISYTTLGLEYKKHFAREIQKSGKEISKSILNLNYKSPFFNNNSHFYRIILDEAQNIKNKNTQNSISVSLLKSDFKWCLSGTPIQNNIDELYPLIRFLNLKPYNDYSRFKNQISLPIKNKLNSGSKKVHAILSAILLRRTKETKIDDKLILELPNKSVVEENVEMSNEENEFYKALETQSAKKVSNLMQLNTKKTYSSILTLLLRMRQACDHEYLVKISDNNDRSERLQKFSKSWDSLKAFENVTINRIERDRENGLMCIKCNDLIDNNNGLLLSKCGHPMCKDCHLEFYQLFALTEWNGVKTAKCPVCQVENIDDLSVDLLLYELFIDERLEWKDIRKRFDLNSKVSDKNWRSNAIDKVINEEDNGKIKYSIKIKKCLELIRDILSKNPNDKIIIFSQFIGFFEIINRIFKQENLKFLQYDGTMSIDAKNDTIKEFYQNNQIKILLLSLKAGNVGLTLTCANHVIILEPFWNPYVERQAFDRVHRISQIKEVFIHRILIKNTVEDRIMELQRQKEELVESALDPNARIKIGQLSRTELGFLFGLNGLSTLENV